MSKIMDLTRIMTEACTGPHSGGFIGVYMSQPGAPLQGAATPTACPQAHAGHPEPRDEEAYLFAFSRVARL